MMPRPTFFSASSTCPHDAASVGVLTTAMLKIAAAARLPRVRFAFAVAVPFALPNNCLRLSLNPSCCVIRSTCFYLLCTLYSQQVPAVNLVW